MKNNDLVKYYGPNNMMAAYHLQKAERILSSFTNDYAPNDINDVIQLDNISKYIKAEEYLKKWTRVTIEDYKRKVDSFSQIIAKFFSSINDENVQRYYADLSSIYIKDFWELISRYNRYPKISQEKVNNMIVSNPRDLRDILCFKDLASYYGNTIRTLMLNNTVISVNLLFETYVIANQNRDVAYNIPKQLTLPDKERIINDYLSSEDVEQSYVRLIKQLRNSDYLRICDATRHKAIMISQKLERQVIDENTFSKISFHIFYDKEQKDSKKVEFQDERCEITYSLRYILSQHSYFELFKNFTDLFEFTDEQGRINLLSKGKQASLIDNFVIRSKTDYLITETALMLNKFAIAQLITYEAILDKYFHFGIEDLIKGYITQLSLTFDVKGLTINMPCKHRKSIEKIRLLIPEIESLLRRYYLFVRYGKIEEELMQDSRSMINYGDIKSLVKDKYLYINENEEGENIVHLLSSDQTSLGYVACFGGETYSSFFELMMSEREVNYSYYDDYQKNFIDYLISKGFIINDNDKLTFYDTNAAVILNDLYFNEVADNYYYLYARESIHWLVSKGYVKYGDSLLSLPEVHYFNWILNSKEFTNSMDLRNKYVHGTQGDYYDETKHSEVYYTMLLVLILLLLKIQDDLILRQLHKK